MFDLCLSPTQFIDNLLLAPKVAKEKVQRGKMLIGPNLVEMVIVAIEE